MPQYSNRDKQERGQNAKNSLESILVECQKYSYITNVEKEFRMDVIHNNIMQNR